MLVARSALSTHRHYCMWTGEEVLLSFLVGFVCLFFCQQEYRMKLEWKGVAWTKKEPNKIWSRSKSQDRYTNHFFIT